MNESERSMTFIPKEEDILFVKNLPIDKLLTISVVIPSYSQAKFLPETLDSVLSQNYPRMEIFVADGGSTDGSVEILEKYASENKAIFRYVSEPDGGQFDAVNKGIESVEGEIIAWINSDDIYLPNTLWKVAAFFYYNRCALVGYGRNRYTDENLVPVVDYPVDWSPVWREHKKKMMHRCLPAQPSLFFRRECYHLFGKLAHEILDYELWLRWQQDTQFYFIDDYLSLSRLHSEAQTIKDTKRILFGICDVVHRYYGLVSYNWTFKQAHTETYGNIIKPGQEAPVTKIIRFKAIYYWFYYNIRWLPRTIKKILHTGFQAVRESLFGKI
ncbi:glycosyltransferase family 2 protein [Desulfococcaceae bacterium HSG7]|nr:glycosyltransferase family 2 protein [Desulfococcaceae bacterium HSG7]